METIKLFMCCHKGFEIVPPLWQPIQCGAALNAPVAGAIPDSTGDNISHKNREYCELTAHYYAWKNISADYYGFCHYRRLFCADDSVKPPYLALARITRQNYIGSEEYWQRLISEYDIIAPRSEDMGIPAGEHYRTSKYHYAKDLELFLKLLAEMAPRLAKTAERYLAQNRQYFCNMFIMDRAHFSEYCGILFPLLEEFDRKKTLHGDFQSDRTDGYLGEIFTGIYITYCRECGAKIKELPRLDTGCTAKKRIFCRILPPESRRRFLAKKIAKKIKN